MFYIKTAASSCDCAICPHLQQAYIGILASICSPPATRKLDVPWNLMAQRFWFLVHSLNLPSWCLAQKVRKLAKRPSSSLQVPPASLGPPAPQVMPGQWCSHAKLFAMFCNGMPREPDINFVATCRKCSPLVFVLIFYLHPRRSKWPQWSNLGNSESIPCVPSPVLDTESGLPKHAHPRSSNLHNSRNRHLPPDHCRRKRRPISAWRRRRQGCTTQCDNNFYYWR